MIKQCLKLGNILFFSLLFVLPLLFYRCYSCRTCNLSYESVQISLHHASILMTINNNASNSVQTKWLIYFLNCFFFFEFSFYFLYDKKSIYNCIFYNKIWVASDLLLFAIHFDLVCEFFFNFHFH